LWPARDPIGQTLRDDEKKQYQVVGVVRDSQASHFGHSDGTFVYMPAGPNEQLTAQILDAQGGGPMHMAQSPLELRAPSPTPINLRIPSVAPDIANSLAPNSKPSLESDAPRGALTSDLVHFFAEAGVMKSVVDAERLTLQQHPAP